MKCSKNKHLNTKCLYLIEYTTLAVTAGEFTYIEMFFFLSQGFKNSPQCPYVTPNMQKKEDINKTSYKNKILQIYTLLFIIKPNVEAVFLTKSS